MATKIPIATSAYFTSFFDGQGGGASNYFTYAEDEDTNFLLLRQTINQMIDEISALSGPNAIAALDAFLWDDQYNPITAPEQKYGVVGAASYEVSIEGGSTTLRCRKGQVYINGQRASLVSDVTGIAGFGGAGTLYIAVDVNGAVFIQDLPAQKALDIASVTWNGAAFTGSVTHLADVFFDGDSWAYVRDRAVTPNVATFSAYTFREGASRIRAIELFLAGQDTGEEGEAIDGPFVLFPGAVGAPSLVMGDGGSTIDSTSGWYRVGANRWAYSSGGVAQFFLESNGINFSNLGLVATPAVRSANAGLYFPNANEVALSASGDICLRCKSPTSLPQALVADGVVGDPGLGFDQEENTGLYRPGAAQLAVALAGAQAALFTAAAFRLPDGAVGAPGLTFLSEQTLGLYRIGTNRLGLATAGTLRAELDAEGNLDLPTNSRVRGSRTATQTIVDNTTTLVNFTAADEFDVGGWHDHTAGSPDDEEFTVPAGGDGVYLIIHEFVWDDPAPNTTFICATTLNGSLLAASRNSTDAGWADDTATVKALVAGDVIRMEVHQDHAPNSSLDLLAARMSIVKLA